MLSRVEHDKSFITSGLEIIVVLGKFVCLNIDIDWNYTRS